MTPFSQICKLAYKKTLSSKQVMKQSEVKDFFRDDVSHFWGLINVDKIAGISGLQGVYTFLHLTFQEYIAAYYLCKLPVEEQNKNV